MDHYRWRWWVLTAEILASHWPGGGASQRAPPPPAVPELAVRWQGPAGTVARCDHLRSPWRYRDQGL